MSVSRHGGWMVVLVTLSQACVTGGGGGKKADATTGSGGADSNISFGTSDGGGTGVSTDATGGGTADGSTGGATGGGACQPGKSTCEGNNKVQCTPAGQWGAPEPCPAGTVCDSGVCHACQSGQRICQGLDVLECGGDGQLNKITTCPSDQFCVKGLCVACSPGTKECRVGGNNLFETWECKAISAEAAEWQKTATCPDTADCQLGICVEPCSSDFKLNTNQGCDYYAVDLENSTQEAFKDGPSAANAQFAVIVSNPSASKDLTVTVHETFKGPAIVTKTLKPKGLEIIKLGPRNVTGTVKDFLAWRLKGDKPFVAYQFNPLDNVNPVYSNDATILLPTNAVNKDYLVMTGTGGGAFLTVVGTKAGTEVTVTVTATTDAGEGIPELLPGEHFQTTLDAGQLLNLRATQKPGQGETLTGSRVEASANVMVFAGNVATSTGERCCADHLEMQMFPTSTWGTTYVAGKFQPRGVESDHWRILAAEDGTEVSFSGGVSNPVTLNRGQSKDIATTADFVITATKPILVGQFMASSYETLPEGTFCKTSADCSSGACSSEDGNGECLDTCDPAQAGCLAHEACIDNSYFSDQAPKSGGSCFGRFCGAGFKACGATATCVVQSEPPGICYQTCTGGGIGACGSQGECIEGTTFGDLCVRKDCASAGDCGTGYYCLPPAPDKPTDPGQCVKKCTPSNNCPKSGSKCLPPGLAANEAIKSGLCIPPECTSDADCDSGRACYIPPGDQAGYCTVIGDPTFSLAVPVEQWRKDYVFLTPIAYSVNYINVLAPTSAFVQLDGKDVPAASFKNVEGTKYMVARVPVKDGTHTIAATEAVSVIVYGYHKDVSYGYPAGLNLTELKK